MATVRVHDPFVFVAADPRRQCVRYVDSRCAQRNAANGRNRGRNDLATEPLRPLRGELLAIGVARLVAFESPCPEAASTLHWYVLPSPCADYTRASTLCGSSRHRSLRAATTATTTAMPTT